MTGSLRTIAAPARRSFPIPPSVAVVIGLAWTISIAAQRMGRGDLLHHDALLSSGLGVAAGGLFVLGWQLMIAAMMLPSSLPLIGLFHRASASQDRPNAARASFLGGYAAVWTAFGVAAFGADALLHAAVDRSAWLGAQERFIGSGVLVVAGAFQFSKLKYRCLHSCRHPGAFLLKHYRRGAAAAFRLGRGHGMYCLGCCWALMLVGFAAGAANIGWMALLAVVMAYEKTGANGERLARAVGIGLVLLGLGTAVVPVVRVL